MSEKFWIDDAYVLLKPIFIPTQNMNFIEKLNTLIRVSIIICLVLILIVQDVRVIIFFVLVSFLTIVLKLHEESKSIKMDNFLNENSIGVVDGKVCTKPTYNNPFMNPTITDYNKKKPSACNIDNYDVKYSMIDKFETKIFKDVDDIYGRYSSERQFYTMPNTTIPNNQGDFAKWLYSGNPNGSCKENNGEQCFTNIDFKQNI